MTSIKFSREELDFLYDMIVSYVYKGNDDLRRDIRDKVFIGLFGNSPEWISFIPEDLKDFVNYDC